MKTIAKICSGLMLMSIFCCISCTKERLDSENKKTEYVPMDDFYTKNKPQEQEFTIDSTGRDSVRGKDGQKYFISPKKFFMYKSNHQDITYPIPSNWLKHIH